MKKLLSNISTFVLILMIPALFIGYLYNNAGVDNNILNNNKTQVQSVDNKEVTQDAGVVYVIKAS